MADVEEDVFLLENAVFELKMRLYSFLFDRRGVLKNCLNLFKLPLDTEAEKDIQLTVPLDKPLIVRVFQPENAVF